MTPVPHTDLIDRIAPTRRPEGSPIGYQSWRDLLFVHWRVPAEEIRPLLPESLTVDTFDGSAWVGLVPFAMFGVRPWWSPSIPGISNFLETNVRTYVHKDGADPGVWFFSLEAANSLAVRIARWGWKLPYFRSRMSLEKAGDEIHYQSQRRWPEPTPAETDITIRLPESRAYKTAEPGTFDHFLVERYYLYSTRNMSLTNPGQLLRGQVHHTPYQYCPAENVDCRETLLQQAGIKTSAAPEPVAYAPGVDVDIFPLVPVG